LDANEDDASICVGERDDGVLEGLVASPSLELDVVGLLYEDAPELVCGGEVAGLIVGSWM
jgi:hypothetical protein